MKGLVPTGKRNGYKTYSIKDAASRLVKPGYEIEAYIRQMSPQELPPLLLKEYWNGQRARLTFEKEQGNYWPTEDIVEFVGVLEQGVRQTILLVVDDVDREEELTDGQKKVVRRIMDGAITTLKDEIVKRFKDYHASRTTDQRADTERLERTRAKRRRVLEAEDDDEVDI